MNIVIDIEACYGCRNCELACSFHHQKVFSPEFSSIRVLTSMRTGKIDWSVDSTCDSCKGEKRPMCVEYCVYEALTGAK